MYIFLTLLLVMLIGIYFVNGRNILSPTVIMIFMHILTLVVFIASKEYFAYDPDSYTFMMVCSSILAVALGEISATAFEQRYTIKFVSLYTSSVKSQRKETPIIIQDTIWFIICCGMFLVFIWYFIKMYSFSLQCGNPGSYLNAVKYVREAILADPTLNLELGTILTQGVLLSEMLSYAFCYLFFYNKLKFGITKKKYLLPTLIYALQTVCSTGRSDIIYLLVVVCMCAFVFMKQKVNWTNKNDKKIIFYGIIAIASFLVIFRLLGYLTQVSNKYGVWENFSRYISASIVGTDMFFEGLVTTRNEIWGQELFKNINAILRAIGFSIPEYSNFTETYHLSVGTSNAYMNLCGFIRDFGIAGMYMIQFVVGAVYTHLIYVIRKGNYSMKRILWLGILFSPIAMSSISNTFSGLFAISMIYKAIYIYLLEQAFVKNRFGICKNIKIRE